MTMPTETYLSYVSHSLSHFHFAFTEEDEDEDEKMNESKVSDLS